jgi:hypothetical protein
VRKERQDQLNRHTVDAIQGILEQMTAATQWIQEKRTAESPGILDKIAAVAWVILDQREHAIQGMLE